MLFEQSYAQLQRAVIRIAGQLHDADEEQRTYLYQELQALHAMNAHCLELWMDFEDQVQDLYEQYFPDSQEIQVSTPLPSLVDDAVPRDDYDVLFQLENGIFMLKKGLGYFDLLMYDESIDTFERMLATNPDLAMVRLLLAISYLAKNRYEESERQVMIVELTAQNSLLKVAAHEAKAQIFVRKGRYDNALTELQYVTDKRPDYIDAHVNSSICAYIIKDYSKAAHAAHHAVTLDEKDAIAWRLYGAALFALKRPKKALACYRKAVQYNPSDTDTNMELAHILRVLHKVEEAQQVYQRMIREHKAVDKSLSGLGELALQMGEFRTAVALYKKLASLQPQAKKPLARLAWAMYSCGLLDDAERIFTVYTNQHGADLTVLTGLTRIATARKQFAEARRYLSRILQVKNERAKVHGLTELGRFYLETGNAAKAVRYLQGALAVDRTHKDALMYLTVAAHQTQANADEVMSENCKDSPLKYS